MEDTLITTTEDLFDASGDSDLEIPEGTTLRVVSDEIDYIFAEALTGAFTIAVLPHQFEYTQRTPKIFRS